MNTSIDTAERIVIKVGSALIVDAKTRKPNQYWLATLAADIAELRAAGKQVVLVSSGAAALGRPFLTDAEKSGKQGQLELKQAAAAIGQPRLMASLQAAFDLQNIPLAQALLTLDDTEIRRRWLNARATLFTLLDNGAVPVINENDTVVTDEIRFGDNDTLAALVANLVEADLLVILTDRDGMFDADPRNNPEAQLIYEARADDPGLDAVAGGTGGALGRGGMQTKLRAARLAARSGAHTVIVGGRIERVLARLKAGERLGTLLSPEREMLAARKQWLAGHLQTRGTLVLDDGAVKALTESHKSLLPVGVKVVQGSFRRGEMVVCVAADGREIARGLSNYSALEAQKIIGLPSDSIVKTLGYMAEPELVHRDNLILV